MKKIIVSALFIVATMSSHAVTFWANGVLMGTICRSGPYFTAYPISMAQPVGTVCPVRDAYGAIIGTGIVTNE